MWREPHKVNLIISGWWAMMINLTEMEQLDAALQQNGFAHQLLTFNGKNGWPGSSDFETALLWIQVDAIKEHLQPQNDTLISALKNDYERRTSVAQSSGDPIREQELLDGAIRALDGLADVTTFKKKLADLVAETGYKNAIALQVKLQEMELKQQQDFPRIVKFRNRKK